ncbi:hypothetical protein ABT185_36385 [Streptomyces clavifer]|uniref:hypothetical protein n=1 Tax=Streptomyces clavifer TaxID=68188 RepID=UPI0033201694
MRSWNTPDHRIAGTERASLLFADGSESVVADWQLIEDAPDAEGRVYTTLRGWVVNTRIDRSGPYARIVDPTPIGEARLVRGQVRGHEPLTDLAVTCDVYTASQPYPNTWDHAGHVASVTWLSRVLEPAADTEQPAGL